MIDNNFVVQLAAKLKTEGIITDVNKLESELAKKGIDLKATLNTTEAKIQAENLAKSIQTILNKNGVDVKLSTVTSAMSAIQKQTEAIQKQRDSFNKSNLNAIDMEIKKREEEASMFSKTLQAQMKARADIESQSSKISESINNNTLSTNIDKLESGFIKAGSSAEEAKTKVSGLRTELESMKNLSGENLINKNTSFNSNYKTLTNQLKEQKIAFDTTKKSEMEYADELQRASLKTSVTKFTAANTNAIKKYGNELNRISAELKRSDLTKDEYNGLATSFKNIQTNAEKAGDIGLTMGGKFKKGLSKIGEWTLVSGVLGSAIQQGREALQFTFELDNALTNINYTMDTTKDDLKHIGNSSIDMAKNLNTSATNVLGAVKLYANANESTQSILDKSKPAVMLSNATGTTAEEQAKNLQAMQNQFELTNNDLTELGDTIETVSKNMSWDYADGINQITEGIKQSGAAAKATGMDYKQYMSLLGAGIESTGLSGSQLGKQNCPLM